MPQKVLKNQMYKELFDINHYNAVKPHIYNLGHNILAIYSFTLQVLSSVKEFVYKLPHKLLNNSRFRILGKL